MGTASPPVRPEAEACLRPCKAKQTSWTQPRQRLNTSPVLTKTLGGNQSFGTQVTQLIAPQRILRSCAIRERKEASFLVPIVPWHRHEFSRGLRREMQCCQDQVCAICHRTCTCRPVHEAAMGNGRSVSASWLLNNGC
jgi:hypothetical protein